MHRDTHWLLLSNAAHYQNVTAFYILLFCSFSCFTVLRLRLHLLCFPPSATTTTKQSLISKSLKYFYTYQHTSAQYCCLASESICAKPPRTRAFIRVLCTELDSKWRGGLRLANCFARFHQLSHCTTMFALNGEGGNGSVRVWRSTVTPAQC